jgi:hypothetical protein
MSREEKPANSRTSLLPRAALLFLLAIGLAIRLYDLTDLPLGFHPIRQLRSAIIARGMFYENLESAPEWKREMAVRQWNGMEELEPTIVERLVATAYQLAGGEHLWFGRLFSILIWMASAVIIFYMARDMSSHDGALIAVAYYLFLPFAVEASRSFLPEPFMVALIVTAVWLIYRWFSLEMAGWRITLVTGVVTGLAALVKVVAGFLLFGVLAGALISRKKIGETIRNPKFWAIVILTLIIGAPYYVQVVFIRGDLQLGARPFFDPEYITTLRFYLDWQAFVMPMVSFTMVILALLGTLGLRKLERGLMVGLWIGYFVYVLSFPYHSLTHSYYTLPFVPVIALGIAWPAAIVLEKLAHVNKTNVWRAAVIGVLLLALAIPLRTSRGILVGRDFRSQMGYWEKLGDHLEHRSDIYEISHDYGFRLEYFGWVNGGLWTDYNDPGLNKALQQDPSSDAVTSLRKRLESHSFLVVTILSELDANPIIKEFLYETYPVYEQGEDFVIFDLRSQSESYE